MRRRTLGGIVTAAALALPLALGGPALAEVGTSEVTSFESSFVHLERMPAAQVPAAGSVDITSIEPPIEIEEAPTVRTLGSGLASYYGRKFNGRRTASGERFNMNDMTAAHKTLPFGTRVRVTNPRNGKSVVVRINDRGPYAHGRTIDLSRAAATEVGIIQRGHGTVELALLD